MLSTGVTQDRVATPSICTVQAPHSAAAAAELRAGHAEHVAQHPQKRRVAVDIDAVCGPVDFNREGHHALLFFLRKPRAWRASRSTRRSKAEFITPRCGVVSGAGRRFADRPFRSVWRPA